MLAILTNKHPGNEVPVRGKHFVANRAHTLVLIVRRVTVGTSIHVYHRFFRFVVRSGLSRLGLPREHNGMDALSLLKKRPADRARFHNVKICSLTAGHSIG